MGGDFHKEKVFEGPAEQIGTRFDRAATGEMGDKP